MAPRRKLPSARTSILSSGKLLISTRLAGVCTLSFMRSSSVVPPAIKTVLGCRTRSSASRSLRALAKLNGTMKNFSLRAFARGLYRGQNVGIGPTAADVAAHAFTHVVIGGAAWLFEQSSGRHDLPRRA